MPRVRLPVTPTAAYLTIAIWTSFAFVPAEPLLVAAGSYAAAGALKLPLAIAAAAVGSLFSDITKYWLGRLTGPAVLRRLARWETGARAVAWVEARMNRAGPSVIVPAYFVPFGVVVATILCGVLRFPLRGVAIASVVGAALWSSMMTLLGYAGGSLAGHPLVGIAIGLPVALLIGAVIARRTTATTAARR